LCTEIVVLTQSSSSFSSVLYFWTGLHSHEGLNLRHGACLLTPSTDRAQSGVASPSPSSGGTSSPNSLHTEPCNLLYVNGQNAYAALPPVHLTQAGASFSFLVKFHSCQLNHAELLRLRVANNDSNADGVSISVHQSKGISVTYWRGRDDHRACHADFDAVKLGQWHHVFTVIQPGSMRLWIDGTLVAKAEGFPLGMAEGTRSWNAIGQKCHAAIKDVRIWAVPLDMDEMAKVEKSLKEMYT
jgi:hypothetical protein